MEIPVGFGQVNFYFTGNAYPRGAQVAVGFENVGALAPAAAATLLGAMWVDTFLVHQSAGMNLEKVKVKLGPNDTGPEATVGIAEAGLVSATHPMSPQVAAIITKLTAVGGRKGKGRIFLPGLVEGDTDGAGRLTAGAQTAYQSDATAFLGEGVSGGTPFHILHSVALDAPTEITSLSVEQMLATQRRRIRRVGGRTSGP